jgi:hypothetical protein
VIPWSPGKWYFGRKRVVRRLLDRFGPQRLLVGDTPLRPMGYPEPLLVRHARREGFRVLAGSDPLPFAGEERQLGRYVTLFSGAAFNPHRPSDSVRGMLTSGAQGRSVGRRALPLALVVRLWRNQRARRRARVIRP